ncbi:hypothetical protein HPB49_022988 [Dermacentor silvarum]|uniref:Uncharacterized protein n=1 Tax=Dermacentor silvarum TaxID=543639 RepID=A0ACB8DS81_DERSI|nr:hypothetical protein HPB49_022988 [Dermacentor silvarum]
MPDHGTGQVHRFRDHVIAGVNWRPTRFVDEVPNSRVCGLCRMIPKQTVLLPCSHALCQSCHGASLEGGVGHCPLDQEPFEETECNGVNFPARKASSLKHSDLPKHYAAGCTAGVPCAIAEYRRSEHTALTIEDVSAALEDLKAMLGDPNHDQLHPVIQNLKDEMAQITAMMTSTVPHQPNPAAEASTSSSLSLRSEKALILRKLEHFTYLSLSALEHLRQTSPHSDSSRVNAYCNIRFGHTQHLISALYTTPARIREIGRVRYVLFLENCDEIRQWQGDLKKFAQITVLHMRDTYFTLSVWKGKCGSTFDIIVRIKFYGMLEDSRCLPPVWRVKVWNRGGLQNRL